MPSLTSLFVGLGELELNIFKFLSLGVLQCQQHHLRCWPLQLLRKCTMLSLTMAIPCVANSLSLVMESSPALDLNR